MTKRQPAGHPANSTRYKRLRARFMERQGRFGVCALCGESVDMSLSGRSKRGPSIDHIVPTSDGGGFFDLDNWQLAHRSCNAKKGRGTLTPAGTPGPRKIPSPYDPANLPAGCTCLRVGMPTPRSPNDVFCDVCEEIIAARRADA